MSFQIGTNIYVIGTPHYSETWFYKGGRKSFSPKLSEAKRYDDLDDLREELDKIVRGCALRIIEIQKCPKCGKEFTEHPAISRVDNETEICSKCGVDEAVDAYCALEARQKGSKNE